MKKAALLCLALAFLLAGCIGPGASDWRYELPNDYEIWRINSRSIRCIRAEGNQGSHVLDGYVSAFCYDERNVGLQCVSVSEDLQEEIDTSAPDYYLLDTQTGELSGPWSLAEWEGNAAGLAELCPWKATNPAPKGTKYD